MARSMYEISQTINFRFYTIFGFWKISSKKLFPLVLYTVYSSTISFITLIYFLLQLIDLKDSLRSIEKLSINLSATSTSMFCVFKIHYFKYHFKRIEKLRQDIRDFLHAPGVGQQNEDREIFERNAVKYMRTWKVLQWLVWITMGSWCFSPLLTNTLPVRLWLPIQVQLGTVLYVVVYILMCILLILMGAVVVCMDLTFFFFVFTLCTHYEVLQKNIRNLGSFVVENDKLMIIGEKEERQKLIDLIKHHQKILRTTQEVDEIFYTPNFVHFLAAGLQISLSAFDFIQTTTTTSFLFLRHVTHFFAAFFDLFMYCYYGSLLHGKSQEITVDLYSCPWYAFRPSTCRMLLFISLRSQRGTILTAGKIIPLSLITYLASLRICYNLIAVFMQLK